MNSNAIKDLIKNCDIVSVYRNNSELFSHFTGFAQIIDDELLIYHITPYGLYDGYILIKSDDIIRIDCNGKYEKNIKKLYEYSKQSHKFFELNSDTALFFLLIEMAQKESYIVSFETNENFVSGLVEKYTENNIWIRVVDEYGVYNGNSVLEIDWITAVYVDTQDEQKINILCNTANDSLSLNENS